MTRVVVVAIVFFGLLAAAPQMVFAHARLMSPAPRNQMDGYKDPPQGPGGPCGIARAASQPSTNMTPGAAVTVTWEETVDHNGCFVIDFAAANDQNFEIIGRKSHANPPARTGTPPSRKYSMQVTLPNTPCAACTLRVRQLMLSANVAEANLATGCPPATIPSGATYYTCANVVMGGGGGTGGSTGAGGASGAAGATSSGGTGAAGQAGASGQAGMSGTGNAGASGTGEAGTSGTGEAGNSGGGNAGSTGQAGSTGNAGTTGQAGTTAGTTGQAGATGQAGTTGAGNAPGGGEGGCRVAAGDGRGRAGSAIILAGLFALTAYRRRRSRS